MGQLFSNRGLYTFLQIGVVFLILLDPYKKWLLVGIYNPETANCSKCKQQKLVTSSIASINMLLYTAASS